MRILHFAQGAQYKLLPFSCQQIPHNQNCRRLVWWRARRKQAGISAVVDDLSRNRCTHPIRQQSPHLVADTDHLACALVDLQRSLAAPSSRDPLLEASVENVQTMNSNNKRNSQTPGKKCRGMPARQRSMSMDQVNRRTPMKMPDLSQKGSAQEL